MSRWGWRQRGRPRARTSRGRWDACGRVVYVVAALALAGGGPRAAAQEPEARGLIVRALRFEGNRHIDDPTLRLSIATSHSGWFQRAPLVRALGWGEKRYLNELEFRRDVLRLRALYQQSGFREATVDTVVRRSPSGVAITFRIAEGEPVRVAALEVTGAEDLLDMRRVRRDLPLQPGDPFNRLLMQASADSIQVQLANVGYPYARIFRNFDVNLEARTATITLDVVPGPLTRVGPVEIVGTDAIDENVVRRTLAFEPGAVYRQRDLYQSQLALYRMEVFDYVTVGLADSTPRPDSTVGLRVRLTEGHMHRVRAGVGYGTVDCFRTLTSWTVHDFLGGGRTLQVNGRFSQIGSGRPFDAGFSGADDGPSSVPLCGELQRDVPARRVLNYNLSASLREPFFFSRRTSASITVFAERRTEFLAYLRRAVGVDAAVTFRAAKDVPVTLGYGLSYGRTEAEPAIYCAYLNVCRRGDLQIFDTTRVRSTLSLAVVRDRRNSILDPTRGTRATLEVRHASRFIGSDSLGQFNKAVAEFASHHPVGRRGAFSWRIRVGTILPAELGLSGGDLQFVPPEERFYAGGANSVRGFGQNEMGPVVRVLDTLITRFDVNGSDTVVVQDSVIQTSPVGGYDLMVVNAEYRFPLPGFSGRLSGAVFVDAGRLFSRGVDQGGDGIQVTPGMGLRVISPLGPIRLDVALNPLPISQSDLYVRSGTQLDLAPEPYRPDSSLLNRFRIHFSVGQAF